MLYFIILLVIVIFCFIVSIPNKTKTISHKVTYDLKTRRVLIDNFFVLVSFRNETMNHKVFEYLAKNENQYVTYDELDKSIFNGRKVELNKIVDAMGFKGELKKILFSFDSKKIIYHPKKLSEITTIKLY
ncbi:hypothetical protein WH390_15020 (plasmid) [Candidatus Arsenophonus nilaparvatae]|uniref:hypothetical protein n=1 Tax=Candidatus Arsenophonus nilaparvatae TaxID=1247023 RepID=UPI0037C07790